MRTVQDYLKQFCWNLKGGNLEQVEYCCKIKEKGQVGEGRRRRKTTKRFQHDRKTHEHSIKSTRKQEKKKSSLWSKRSAFELRNRPAQSVAEKNRTKKGETRQKTASQPPPFSCSRGGQFAALIFLFKKPCPEEEGWKIGGNHAKHWITFTAGGHSGRLPPWLEPSSPCPVAYNQIGTTPFVTTTNLGWLSRSTYRKYSSCWAMIDGCRDIGMETGTGNRSPDAAARSNNNWRWNCSCAAAAWRLNWTKIAEKNHERR